MTDFSPIAASFWKASFEGGQTFFADDRLHIDINPQLRANRSLMLLETTAGKLWVTMTPARADQINLSALASVTPECLRERLHEAGMVLHGADCLFYLPQTAQQALQQTVLPDAIRLLSAADEAVFSAFQSASTAQDWDDAYVELDHWAVFGAFDRDRLVCAASMYPWDNTRLADLGVLTLPPFRGHGHARGVVRAISQHALALGYEPQFRCQLDNTASAALAKAAGFSLFGWWDLLAEGDDE